MHLIQTFPRIIILFAFICFLLPMDAKAKIQEPEIEAIHNVLHLQQTAWNAGDIETYMQGYWKNEQLKFFSGGEISYGWQATLEGYHRRYPNTAAMGRLTFDLHETTLLSPTIASVLGDYHLDLASGEKANGYFSLILRKIDGQWKIVQDHTAAAP